jgi:flavin-binding protein dodecin
MVIKVLELMGCSATSWEDATRQILVEASKTIQNIRSVNIQNFSAKVEDGNIVEYRVNGKVTFEVK